MMGISVAELASALRLRLVPEQADAVVTGVASVHSARAGDLVFVAEAKLLDAALASEATAVIAGEFAASRGTAAKPLLIATHPKLAFARAAALVLAPETPQAGIHATAVVDASARVAAGASIGPHAVLEANVEIGNGAAIGAHCFLGSGVRIGAGCKLGPHVTVYSGTVLGERVMVQAGAVLGSEGFGYVRDNATGRYEQFPQVGTLLIGDDVEIGAGTTIDRGALDSTVIGRGTKIDNLVHIGHNVHIGDNVIIAAQVGISGSVEIEDGAVLGGQVGVGDHARVGRGVVLGGGAGVFTGKEVQGAGEVFWGRPARPLRQVMKELAVLTRLGKGKK